MRRGISLSTFTFNNNKDNYNEHNDNEDKNNEDNNKKDKKDKESRGKTMGLPARTFTPWSFDFQSRLHIFCSIT